MFPQPWTIQKKILSKLCKLISSQNFLSLSIDEESLLFEKWQVVQTYHETHSWMYFCSSWWSVASRTWWLRAHILYCRSKTMEDATFWNIFVGSWKSFKIQERKCGMYFLFTYIRVPQSDLSRLTFILVSYSAAYKKKKWGHSVLKEFLSQENGQYNILGERTSFSRIFLCCSYFSIQ